MIKKEINDKNIKKTNSKNNSIKKDLNTKVNNKTVKKSTPQTKKNSKPSDKITTTKKSIKKKNTPPKKKNTTQIKKITNTRKTSRKNIKKIDILEYYDLPYRYNQTIVKVLSQTPTTLFVYWDISDSDRNNLINYFGQSFFNETKPVLIIHNETKNYSYEIDINDFANSWYLHIPDSNCVYTIELGRRVINTNNNQLQNISNNYIFITSSNKMETPNDHILFNSINDTIYFKNIKTNKIEAKKITSITLMKKIEKIYNIKDIYKKIYPDEKINFLLLNNPSSMNSSFFK